MTTNTRTIQMVVGFLGVMATVGLGMICTLAYQEKPVPDALIAITMFTSGAVAGLLAKTSSEPIDSEIP